MAKLFTTVTSFIRSFAQNMGASGSYGVLACIATSLSITCGASVAAATGNDVQKPPQATPSVVPGGGSPTVNYFEQNILIRSGETVEALGPTLMGDSINEYTGNLEFTHTDLSIPGNNSLPVAVGRHVATGVRQVVGYQGLFGDWDLEIPRLHTIVTNTSSWYGSGNSLNRCSQMAVPPFATAYASTKSYSVSPHQYWDGYHIYVPGVGDQALLTRSAANTEQPTDGYTYPIVTKQHWQVRCLASLERGTGEGFFVRSPDGVQYQFDHMVTRTHLSFKAAVGALLPRNEVLILPTQITDRFGNWVRYTYGGTDGMRVQSITSSDGRSITFTYNGSGNRIGSITDGTRTWSYGYDANGALQTVTQPDSSQWTFSLFQLERDPLSSPDPDCSGDDVPWDAIPKTGTVTHPSGAIGTFSLQMTMHGRSNVPGSQATCSAALVSRYFTNYAIKSKQLSGPGMSTMIWNYAYSSPTGSYAPCGTGCVNTKTVTITDPQGNVSVNTFGTQFGVNDGSLLSSSEGVSGSTSLRTTTYGFQASNAGPYPALIGSNGHYGNSMGVIHTPQNLRSIAQQGATFTQASSGFDVFARSTSVTRSSTLGHSRAETTVFADYKSLWVLGQVDTQTIAGLVAVQNTYYPANAMLWKTWKFGKLQSTLAYSTDGTFASVADGLGNTTGLSSYKRGIPQLISFADGTSKSATVNDIGLVTSVTSEAGAATKGTYAYDLMGRLSRKTAPAGDSVAYNDTVVSFVQVGAAEVGIAANHWRQTVTTGNSVTINYFDARWRKVMTTSYDAGNRSATERIQLFTYDPYNRTTFASYPSDSATIVGVGSNPPGTWTTYDALGRPTLVQESSELSATPLATTTQYLSPFQKVVTNPRGFVTSSSFQAFDEPNESVLASVSLPEGATVGFVRDALSKPISVTRSGLYAGSPVSVTRSYVYDANQLLCKTVDPEVGATIQTFDAANNLAWRATGLSLTSTTACNVESVPSDRKVAFAYDTRNRLTGTGFSDGSPPIGRSYTADGLPLTVVGGGGNYLTWSYTYNNRRLMTEEKLTFSTGTVWPVGRAYDANGNMAQLTYPDASTIAYLPNALGQSTQVGTYATGVSYHPNGAVKGYTLGNGIVHSVSQNTRGLPAMNQDAGVLNDQYSYDAVGNILSITDVQQGAASRSMSYDGLDRLKTANSPGVWGAATYDYDPLSNLRTSAVGTRNSTHSYDANNRLSSITTNGLVTGYSYDIQGNINARGSQGFYFDQGNRMQLANGAAQYIYDGLGRRTSTYKSGGLNLWQLYAASGQLLFENRQSGASGWWTRYLYLDTKLIATVDSAAGTVYQHTDMLGSPVATTSATGALIGRTWYEAYGRPAAGAVPTGPGFTGHVNDADTSLVYMQQRYYDPVSARFLSIDPVPAEAETGKKFNLFEYAQSNPYRYTDPDGRDPEVVSKASWSVTGSNMIQKRTEFSDGSVKVSGPGTAGMSQGPIAGGGVKPSSGAQQQGLQISATVGGLQRGTTLEQAARFGAPARAAAVAGAAGATTSLVSGAAGYGYFVELGTAGRFMVQILRGIHTDAVPPPKPPEMPPISPPAIIRPGEPTPPLPRLFEK